MNRVQRIDAEERFVQLAADAIQRRHPAAGWLALHAQMPVRISDSKLTEAIGKLSGWLEEHPEPPPGQG